MKKHIFGRKLQRDTNERKALFKSLMSELVIHESIKTTEAKAKAVKGSVEKLVTKAKMGGGRAERALQPYFAQNLLRKMIDEIAPRFEKRNGGYTRIIKIGSRLRDNSSMVVFEWVDKKPEVVASEVIGTEQISNPTETLDAEVSSTEKVEKIAKKPKKDGQKKETRKEIDETKKQKGKKKSNI